jgi:HD-like signal output (HDOD) protein
LRKQKSIDTADVVAVTPGVKGLAPGYKVLGIFTLQRWYFDDLICTVILIAKET